MIMPAVLIDYTDCGTITGEMPNSHLDTNYVQRFRILPCKFIPQIFSSQLRWGWGKRSSHLSENCCRNIWICSGKCLIKWHVIRTCTTRKIYAWKALTCFNSQNIVIWNRKQLIAFDPRNTRKVTIFVIFRTRYLHIWTALRWKIGTMVLSLFSLRTNWSALLKHRRWR